MVTAGPPLLEQMREADSGPDILADVGLQPGSELDQPENSPILRTKGDVVFPLGLLETFAMNQSKQVQRIFEIGSARSYFIPGRTVQGLNLGKIFTNGPNLLRSLYAVYRDDGDTVGFSAEVEAVNIPYHPEQTPGYGQFLINLQSDLFNQAFGVAVFFKDQRGRWYGAFYCEMAFIQGHQLSISAGSNLLVEGVSVQFDTCRPIDVTGARQASKFIVSTPPAFSVGATTAP